MNKLKISPSGNNNVWEYENFGNESNKTIKYERLVPMLVEAIKELKTDNDALRSRISALEGS